MLADTICSYCGVTFKRERKFINRTIKNNGKTYCSVRCDSLDRDTSVLTTCNYCGAEIKIRMKEYTESKNHYCSHSCAASVNNIGNHNNYKHGISVYRDTALQQYGIKCSICLNNNIDELDVHHIDGNRYNNDINNLCVLCTKHHTMVHAYIKKLRHGEMTELEYVTALKPVVERHGGSMPPLPTNAGMM